MTNAVTWLANGKAPVVAASSSDPVSWMIWKSDLIIVFIYLGTHLIDNNLILTFKTEKN